jgi:asparagine synthase (glutamine-hydrolysing)
VRVATAPRRRRHRIGNGEIYNYLELIEEHGLTCATGSDFEPLLHLYAREGERAFERLRGMYAFCLIGGDGRTWLVRDPFGIKPLYLAGARFASEPRALGTTALTREAVEEVLTLNYRLSGRAALQPGEVRETASTAHPRESGDPGFRAGASSGHVSSPPTSPWGMKQAWVPASAGMSGGRCPPEAELLDQLDRVLEDSVRVHQRSDVPYGLFLSGGIDSAAIATLMARLNSRPVTAYTCGFDAPGARDERAAAERVARALNLDWRETTFGEADFWRVLPKVAWALDDPTTDYATLPTYKLAEAAKGTLTVVLTGEGGDELFGGYGRYRRALRPALFGGRPAEPQVDAPFLKTAARARSPAGVRPPSRRPA